MERNSIALEIPQKFVWNEVFKSGFVKTTIRIYEFWNYEANVLILAVEDLKLGARTFGTTCCV